MEVTYICRSRQAYFFFVAAFLGFGRFVTREVQKHEKGHFPRKRSSWQLRPLAHHKKCFFPPVFFTPGSRLFCSIFFPRVFGRFLSRGVQKRKDKKKSQNFFRGRQKKELTYLLRTHLLILTSLFFFLTAPLGPWLCAASELLGTYSVRAA
jgi:hypothetical protein